MTLGVMSDDYEDGLVSVQESNDTNTSDVENTVSV